MAMTWEYKTPVGKRGSVRVTGRYACDNWEVLREWAVAGLGVALKSTWDVRKHLEDGSLVPLLPGYDFSYRRRHLRGLPAPAPPAGEDARVHRFSRRVFRPRAVLGQARRANHGERSCLRMC